MPNFVVNTTAQANGDHEVHNLDMNNWCLPASHNRHALGYHWDCSGAVQQARQIYTQVNGCAFCAPACHTS